MNKKTLKRQFITKTLIILLALSSVSGVLQLLFINEQIKTTVEKEAFMVANSIEQGIKSTNLAEKSIEKQIDSKMESYSRRVADMLKDKNLDEITNEDLMNIRDIIGLSGLTLIARTENGDNIVGVKSTEPSEIGFSIKEYSESGYANFDRLLKDESPVSDGFYSYMTDDMISLPISQSAANDGEQLFFKYAYYHETGTDYLINPFIEANEVYQFTQEVGPESWIKSTKENNEYVEEIAVLDPRVYKDPSLAEKVYPPLKEVVYGTFNYVNETDKKTLAGMVESTNVIKENGEHDGKKLHKMFLPTENGNVIYIALDYEEMSGPLYKHSLILIVTGLISLVSLFLLIAKFFNRIYENIEKIINQIKLLEEGDLTAKSKVNDGSELDKLSKTTNRMVEKLNQLVMDTQEQAKKTQRLSMILETDAAQSVDKMYALSTEATMKSREQLYEITEFLNSVLNVLESSEENSTIIKDIEKMRKVANDRTASVTNTTITLSDLMQSLHEQSSELTSISNKLLEHISKFKL
ncbi:methyl-accepting chemotaxis protein [Domibacillus epiphyticus]|uniref:HAMP domain-containing protein n=1 Tax=Domibacillus epiphyticus TaxID=1714355 RepID=A0A1V2A931_9BACI|nr:methyl-accepting chemotaxis protein [Domibacillus epiphyticus]OMP67509.1 hypothetical protein BTO28_06055 [Domibacillus epiphyticus]